MHVCLGVDEGAAIFVFIVYFNLWNGSLCRAVKRCILSFILEFGFFKTISCHEFWSLKNSL